MTHPVIPNFAPGCYGSALGYKEDSPACKRCPYENRCVPVHQVNLEAMRERLGITPKMKAAKKPTASPATVGGALALPAKVQALVNRLDSANLHIAEKLAKGENPFEGKIPFLQIACHLLLKLKRPVSRAVLTQALITKLGWQENTAEAHARMAYQALTHIGVITEDEVGATIKQHEVSNDQ